MSFIPKFAAAIASLAALSSAALSQAATTYTLTQSQSQLNLNASGSVLGQALTVTEQQASAITRYNGTMVADFPGSPLAGGSLNFPGGGAAAAINPTGAFSIPLPYQPNVNGGSGSAAANYGLNLVAPLNYDLPPIPIEGNEIDLGVLSGVSLKLAVRDLVLDVDAGNIAIGAGGTFDASQTSLSVVSGFADVSGGFILDQDNFISTLAVAAALTVLTNQYPDLGLTVNTDLVNSNVTVGFGTRLDLATIGNTALPNTSATAGTVTYNPINDASTLTLPVLAALPADLGLGADILQLDLSLTGQLRGTGTLVPVPEPSSIAIAATALVGLVACGVRSRRRS